MCAAAALLAGLNELAANFLRHYPQYKSGAFNLTELARLCDISRTTAYKYIGLLEKKTAGSGLLPAVDLLQSQQLLFLRVKFFLRDYTFIQQFFILSNFIKWRLF